MNLIISFGYHDVVCDNNFESGFQNIGAIQYKLRSNVFEHQIGIISDYLESKQLDKNLVALTFDDGGESFYSVIAPVLEKYGFKGYFFITTSLIGTKGFVSREQVKELHTRGHVIGTHSHTHPKNISNLSYGKIEEEWSNSVEILSNIISEKVRVASIPGGFYSEKSRKALLKCGIEIIFTSYPSRKVRHNADNQYIIGRFSIKKDTSSKSLIRLISNNGFFVICEFIKWKVLALARLTLGNKYYLIREALLKSVCVGYLILTRCVLINWDEIYLLTNEI